MVWCLPKSLGKNILMNFSFCRFSIRCCIAWKILFRSKRLNLCALANNYLFIKRKFSIIMNFHARTDSIEDWDFLMWCLRLCVCVSKREKPPSLDALFQQSLDFFFFPCVEYCVRSDLWNIVITRFLLSIFRLHLDPIAHQQHTSMHTSHRIDCVAGFWQRQTKILEPKQFNPNVKRLPVYACMWILFWYVTISHSLTRSLSRVCFSCRSNKTLDFKSYTRKCF